MLVWVSNAELCHMLLCLTGLWGVEMPYLDMSQGYQITLLHARPCYAKLSCQSVCLLTHPGNINPVVRMPIGPISPSWQQQRSHRDPLEANHWSRWLKSNAKVIDNYTLTTTKDIIPHSRLQDKTETHHAVTTVFETLKSCWCSYCPVTRLLELSLHLSE